MLVAAFFFSEIHSAELAQGRAPRFVGIHPIADVPLGLLLNVKVQLGVEFAIKLFHVEQFA
jgi:hypothetical protein